MKIAIQIVILPFLISFYILSPLWSEAAFDSSMTDEKLLELNTPFSGDFDKMIENRFIRILVPYNRSFFSLMAPEYSRAIRTRGLKYSDA